MDETRKNGYNAFRRQCDKKNALSKKLTKKKWDE